MKKFKYDLTDEEDIEKLFFDTAKIFGIIFVILLIWSGFELLYFDKVNNYTKELVLTADKKYENRKKRDQTKITSGLPGRCPKGLGTVKNLRPAGSGNFDENQRIFSRRQF